jgi:DNA mismatch repair protein MutS
MNQLLKQYQNIKAKYPDAILLFRVGDFFKTFEEDAKAIGKTLGDSLSIKGKKTVAGFPVYSLDNALRKLVKAGYKVAVCEQLEDPKKKAGKTK